MHNPLFTLSLAVALGILLMVVARALRVPSIVLLLAGGMAVGPFGLGWIHPEELGHGLEVLVSMGIAVILFEGGLTLDVEGYRRSSTVIRRILTAGPLITWFGIAATVAWLFAAPIPVALLAASLVIVTGPTVVLPILRRVRVKEALHHVLYWEGVLIDVVGVFIAVLCYEWISLVGHGGGGGIGEALGNFGVRVLLGASAGVVVGWAVAFVLRRQWIAQDQVNIFVLGMALVTFGGTHAVLPETGVLAVVVAGLTLALRRPPGMHQLKEFKLQLTEVGIATIFVLLAAKLDMRRFSDVRLVWLLLVVMFVLRPMVVWLATWRQPFTWRDKVFLSWIAPRGIVAASMASLFSLRLESMGSPFAPLLETTTYAIVIATVAIEGISAPFVARALGVQQRAARTWVVVGEPHLVRFFCRALRRTGVPTVEIPFDGTAASLPDPDGPDLAQVHAVLFVGGDASAAARDMYAWGVQVRADHYYRWNPDQEETAAIALPDGTTPCTPVWKAVTLDTVMSAEAQTDHRSFDVVEVGDDVEPGRFGKALIPLVYVRDGRATIIGDPDKWVPDGAGMVVVFRPASLGLARLLAHVELIPESATFDHVVRHLVASAARQMPELPAEEVIADVFARNQAIPVSLGAGIAVPHAYWNGVERSQCYLAVVRGGVRDLPTPDDVPVRLVCLLLSPTDQTGQHLESLAVLARLAHDRPFVELLVRQDAPARVLHLLTERG